MAMTYKIGGISGIQNPTPSSQDRTCLASSDTVKVDLFDYKVTDFLRVSQRTINSKIGFMTFLWNVHIVETNCEENVEITDCKKRLTSEAPVFFPMINYRSKVMSSLNPGNDSPSLDEKLQKKKVASMWLSLQWLIITETLQI